MRVADLTVAVRSMYDRVARQCADYLLPSSGFESDRLTADIVVETTQPDIDRERDSEDTRTWRDDYLETLAVYRQIADAAPALNRLLFHGATIEYGGRAYVFTAPSGTGKTTHIRQWRRVLGERVDIINGDKPLFRVDRDGEPLAEGLAGRVIAYGTPWCGKEGWQRNTSAPIAGICVVTRAAGGTTVEDESAEVAARAASSAPDAAVEGTAVDGAVAGNATADGTASSGPTAASAAVREQSDVARPGTVVFYDDAGIANTCVRLDPAEALPFILRQTYQPSSPLAVADMLGLLDALFAAVPVYRLACTISDAAVRASFTAMVGEELE